MVFAAKRSFGAEIRSAGLGWSVGAVPTVEGLYVLLREHLGLGRAE